MSSSVIVGFKPTYHGVVLAAGRNTRLAGVIPSYHKPLMVVNGRPLVVNIVRELLTFCETVTVVVSPENAGVISEVLDANYLIDDQVNLVLQPRAKGPGEAVLRAMRAGSNENRTMIVCADNIIPPGDYNEVLDQDTDACRTHDPETVVTASTVTSLHDYEAERFTRIHDGHFLEGVPGGHNERGEYACWIGPLVVPTLAAERAYRESRDWQIQEELKVSGPLNLIPHLIIRRAEGNSVDIGTSDSLFQVIKETA